MIFLLTLLAGNVKIILLVADIVKMHKLTLLVNLYLNPKANESPRSNWIFFSICRFVILNAKPETQPKMQMEED